MRITVIDGQGGRIGALLVERIKRLQGEIEVVAVGTNGAATAAMLKAGADCGATGENPVAVACRDSDLILGPIGIVLADALLGEVTAAMAAAISRSRAHKILIPINRCGHSVVGVQELPLSAYIEQAVEVVDAYLKRESAAKS